MGVGGGVPRTQFPPRSSLLPISNVPFQRHSYPQINKTTSIFVRLHGLQIPRAGWSVLLCEGAVKHVKVRGQSLVCVFPRLPSTLVWGCFVLFRGCLSLGLEFTDWARRLAGDGERSCLHLPSPGTTVHVALWVCLFLFRQVPGLKLRFSCLREKTFIN